MSTLYFEDIEIGRRYLSPGRTITEADLTFFNMLSGDWNPIHSNAEYAKSSTYGQRLVAGTFGFALVMGAFDRWGLFEESAIALLNIRDWNFRQPILIGDTIHVAMEFTAKRLTSRGDRGIVERRVELINQSEAVVQSGLTDIMLKLRR
jgi:acyl dehydratase